jgi:hypothetical protein
MNPFYRIRYDDGSHFDYSSDPEAMRAQIARISPADVAGYDRFVEEAETSATASASSSWAALPTTASVTCCAPARSWCACAAGAACTSMVSTHMQDPKLRIAFSLQSLLIGGNPFNVTSVYSLINALERRYGVHWAMGGTGALVQGLVGLLQARGVPLRCNAEVKRIVVENGRATGVELADGERLARRHRSQQRRHRLDLPPPDRSAAPAALDRPAHRAQEVLDEPVRLVLRHQPPVLRRAAPHDGAGPALRRPAEGHLQAPPSPDDFSLYLHRPTATDPGMAPPGHDAFYALSPVPHLDSGTDWPAMAETYRRASSSACTRRCCPGWARTSSLARDHAAGLPRPAAVLQGRGLRHGAAAAAKRLLPPAQPQRGRAWPLPGRCGHAPGRRRARRADVRQSIGNGGSPMHNTLPDTPVAMPDYDLQACRKLMRGGSKSFFAASLLLPSRVCAPASALYAFCRLADDAIDLGQDPAAEMAGLRRRLDAIYEGRPGPQDADRALAHVVHRFAIPRLLLDALLEGFLWDADGRRYETLEEVQDYARAWPARSAQ